MFGRIIREWRSYEEGYKGTWSPGGGGGKTPGFNLPPEDPDNPRSVAPAGKFKLKTPAPSKSNAAPAGTMASTGQAKRPATPPPIPAAARRKGPPPIPAH